MILDHAFAFCGQLQSIAFPASLSYIGELAFYQSGLCDVELGSGLVSIGDGAFAACLNLTAISVDAENSSYGALDNVLFSIDQSRLVQFPASMSGSYTVPATVTAIQGYAFAGAEKLKSVQMQSGLTRLGTSAFENCTDLASVVFSDTLQIMESRAFFGCSSLPGITLPESLETMGEEAFSFCTDLSQPVTVPKNVLSLGRYAFGGDFALKSIVIAPESRLSRLGYGVFADCGIENFTVPESITSMGQEVFSGCKDLVTVTFEGENGLENLAAWTFKGADQLRQITFESGSQLKHIEARACEGLTRLERVVLENCADLTVIDNYAFWGCEALADLILPESLTEIGRYAFANCISLHDLRMPSGLKFIGRYAFSGNEELTVFFRSATLPLELQENWDSGIRGYYLGITSIQTSGDWKYALTEDGSTSITDYIGTETDLTLSSVDGHPITSIGSGAFAGNTALQSISLPDTLTGIYSGAFKDTVNLNTISIPASVQIIDKEVFRNSGLTEVHFAPDSRLQILGSYAFAGTKNLTAVTVPAEVEKLRDYAFYESGIGSIDFAEESTLKEIGRFAFAKSSLRTIALPDGLQKIDYNAFREAGALTEVDFGSPTELMVYGEAFYRSGLQIVRIPVGVSYLGEFCFTGCENLNSINVDADNTHYASIGGVLFDKAATKLITCPAGKTGSYTVSDAVTTLAFGAFEGSRLSEVRFGEDSRLLTIGYRAFYDCDSLSSFNIPRSVLSIDSYAFAYCDGLKSVDVHSDGQLGGIYLGAFYNCVRLTDYLIPYSVQEIGDYAFYGCSAMVNVQLGEESQLKQIGSHAFEYAGITEFVMPGELLEICSYAFRGSQLRRLTMNDCLLTIEDYAFADCGLDDTRVLEIPLSVSYLGLSAFREADQIEEITVPFVGRVVNDSDYRFADLFGGNASHVRKITILGGSSISRYAFWNSDGIMNGLEEVTLPDTLTELGGGAFMYDYNLRSIDIPDGVSVLRGDTFSYSGVRHVSLPTSLVEIEGNAFFWCSDLEEIELPAGLKIIGGSAFDQCFSLRTISLPASVAEIGTAALSGCSSLERIDVDPNNPFYVSADGILYNSDRTKIVSVPGQLRGVVQIPEGIEQIESNLFKNCVNITGVEFPDSLRYIGGAAFSGCSSLKEVYLPETVTDIGNQVFMGCSSLESAVIDSPLEDLRSMLYWCSGLKEVQLPDTLRVLGSWDGCNSLEELIVPDSVMTIESVRYCRNLKRLYIGKGVESILSSLAFDDCNNLNSIEVSPENTHFTVLDGILYSDDHKVVYAAEKDVRDTVILPDTVEVIWPSAFQHCDYLERIVLSNNVREIGLYAFAFSASLNLIEIGTGVERIDGDCVCCTPYYWNQNNWEDGVLYLGNYAVASNITEERDPKNKRRDYAYCKQCLFWGQNQTSLSPRLHGENWGNGILELYGIGDCTDRKPSC